MSNEEAVEALNSCACNWYLEEALDMAVEALKKQIPLPPKDVTYDDDGEIEFYNCPNCGRQHTANINNEVWIFSHCPFCGQAIDWSKE